MTTLYDVIGDTPTQARGLKLTGTGEWVIENLEIRTSESNQGLGTLWIVDFRVVESANPEHPVGCERSWVAFPTNGPIRGKMERSNIKAHIAASLGLRVENADDMVTRDIIQQVNEDNLLAGTLVRLMTKEIKTKNSRDFLVYIWRPYVVGEISKAK